MRNISEQAADAFLNNEKFSSGNTKVVVNYRTTSMFLHGNHIAENTAKGIKITDCGYRTPNGKRSATTKEKLNAIPNVNIHQFKDQWFLNGNPWDGSWIDV